MNTKRRAVVGVMVAVMLVYGSSHASSGFSNRILRGVYGFSGSGTLAGGTVQAAVIGLNSFDGNGGCRITARINALGGVTPVNSVTCEYTVNTDGIGILDVTFDTAPFTGPFHSDFVVIDSKEVHFMLSDGSGGTVATGLTRRQTPHQQ